MPALDDQQPRRDAVLEAREAEDLGVQAREHRAQPVAEQRCPAARPTATISSTSFR